MRVVLTGGGTGGHITPLLGLAQALRDAGERGEVPDTAGDETGVECIAVGAFGGNERAAFASAGIPVFHIPSGKIRRYLAGAPWTLMDLLLRLPLGILRALGRMFVLMPDVVFSKGGYGSIPVTIAAWVYRIPALLHETDLKPGLANRRLARVASAIAVGFPPTEAFFPSARVFTAGTPLRGAFRALPSPRAARARLGLHDRKPVLLVTGGSQGSQRINAAVLAVAVQILPEVQIVHQVGEANAPAVKQFVAQDLRHVPDIGDYHVSGSLSEADMAAAFASADLVIGRAGGTTLAELAASGKPSVLVPLGESAQQHQWENAHFFREHGAAVVVDETNLTQSVLRATLRRLLARPDDLRLMGERARSLDHPRAEHEIASVLIEMAQRRLPRRVVLVPAR